MLRASSLGLYHNLRLPCQTIATLSRRLPRRFQHTDPHAHQPDWAETGFAAENARRELRPEFEVGCSRDAGPVGGVGRAETDGGGTTAMAASEEELDPEVQRRMAKIRAQRAKYRVNRRLKNEERRRAQRAGTPWEQPEEDQAEEDQTEEDQTEEPIKARPPHTVYERATLKDWPKEIQISPHVGERELTHLQKQFDDDDDTFSYLYRRPATATTIEELPHSPRPTGTIFSANRYRLLHKLATVQKPDAAWAAYVALARLPAPPRAHWLVPFAHLHRLVRVLGTAPRTRRTYLRVLAVLSALHRAGGRTRRWEWNLLIDCAGNGLRRTRRADFSAAVEVYLDMTGGRAPGTTFAERRRALEDTDEEPDEGPEYRPAFAEQDVEGVESEEDARTPDIYTYETLLTIAAASRHRASIQYASGLLARSGLAPTLGCHLALVRYFAERGELSGMRSAILRMREQGLRLNGIAINACLWAYVRGGRVDIASALYRVLRAHAVPEEDPDADADVRAAEAYLLEREKMAIPPGLTPDEITFQIMVQGYARTGDFTRCVAAFSDMLSIAPRPRDGPPLPPMLHAYRAVFLGFFHHGEVPGEEPPPPEPCGELVREAAVDTRGWTAAHLRTFFTRFLELPHDRPLSERLFFWIIMGFARTTGRDARVVKKVWEELEAKFGRPVGGRLRTLKKRVFEAAEDADDGHGSNLAQSHKLDD